MSIKTKATYNRRHDKVIGFEDYGNGESSNFIANYVTVFMIRSMCYSWKQPIGFFVTSGVMSALK